MEKARWQKLWALAEEFCGAGAWGRNTLRLLPSTSVSPSDTSMRRGEQGSQDMKEGGKDGVALEGQVEDTQRKQQHYIIYHYIPVCLLLHKWGWVHKGNSLWVL